MEGIDPRDMRAGDPDREHVAEVLRRAAGEGRIDIDELEERLEQTYAAKTYRDLDAIVADLPSAGGTAGGATPAPPSYGTAAAGDERTLELRAMMSDAERTGEWIVPSSIFVQPAMGNVKLDFRHATCAHREVEVEVKGGTGNVVLILPKGWVVDTDDLRSGWGSIKNKRAGAPDSDGVVVRVTGGIGMGTLTARDGRFYDA